MEYFIRSLDLRIESVMVTARVRIAGSSFTVPLEYFEAAGKATTLKLRTLDLMQLAYAVLINSLKTRIERFVASDSDILAESDDCTDDRPPGSSPEGASVTG